MANVLIDPKMLMLETEDDVPPVAQYLATPLWMYTGCITEIFLAASKTPRSPAESILSVE